MRVVIEIDGLPAVTAPAATGAEAVGAAAGETPADAGGGPGDAGGTETVEAGVVTDSGPPPDWLLEAVAAAEVEGHGTAPAAGGETTEGPGDAGAGPGA